MTVVWEGLSEAVWRDGGLFDGWSEHFDFDRWVRCAEEQLVPQGVSLAWYTTRQRPMTEVLPWDRLDLGLDRNWLWQDYQDALAGPGGTRLPLGRLQRLRGVPEIRGGH